MPQLVGEKCQYCQKEIQVALLAYACANCGSVFHKLCLPEKDPCPFCKDELVDSRQQVIEIDEIQKLPNVCCGCLEETNKFYKIRRLSEEGTGWLSYALFLLYCLIRGAVPLLLGSQDELMKDTMNIGIPICKKCRKNKNELFSIEKVDFKNYTMTFTFKNLDFVKIVEEFKRESIRKREEERNKFLQGG